MSRSNRVFSRVFLVLVCFALSDAVRAADEPSTLILLPARYRLVKLLQDVSRIRQVDIIACQGDSTRDEPVLHRWAAKEWSPVRLGALDKGPTPERVILIGDKETIPASLSNMMEMQCENLHRVETLDVGAVAVMLNSILGFKPGELEWLAKKNNLKITDRNAERRRTYGRWGAPPPDEATGKDGLRIEPPPPEPVLDSEEVGGEEAAVPAAAAGAGGAVPAPADESAAAGANSGIEIEMEPRDIEMEPQDK